MPTKKIITLVLALLLLAAGCKSKNNSNNKPNTGNPSSSYLVNLNKQMDVVQQKLAEAKAKPGAKNSKIEFGGNLFLAHGAFIPYFPVEDLIRYADGLNDAGITRVDINPSVTPWIKTDTTTITKYDQVIKHIKANGQKVVLNPQYDRDSFPVKSFSDWETPALEAYGKIAASYKPDIFIVAHEPTTMAKRMGIKTTPEQWKSFVEKAMAVIKKASPSTRVGAGGLPSEMAYFKAFTEISGLDVVTMNVYSLDSLEENNKMILLANSVKKPIYIGETWRFPDVKSGSQATLETMSSSDIGYQRNSAVDAKWLKTLAEYSSVWGIEAVTPFWTQTFFAYVPDNEDGNAIGYPYNKAVAEALKKGERTDTFSAMQDLVKQYGK